jgi:hypothetical protein
VIVVLDSNVWVSALEFSGTPGLALTQALTIDQLAISDFIEHEVVRVLTRKFHREPGALYVRSWMISCAGRIACRFRTLFPGYAGIPTTIPYWRLPWRQRRTFLWLVIGICSA